MLRVNFWQGLDTRKVAVLWRRYLMVGLGAVV